MTDLAHLANLSDKNTNILLHNNFRTWPGEKGDWQCQIERDNDGSTIKVSGRGFTPTEAIEDALDKWSGIMRDPRRVFEGKLLEAPAQPIDDEIPF